MKTISNIPDSLISKLQSDHERALQTLASGRELYLHLPMHTANMNVKSGFTHEGITSVIVPPLNIYVQPDGMRDGMLERGAIEYRIAYNQAPFPLAHVYGSSGHLCLGNIFVPQLIPAYAPQQPLETLFLHNDRHVAHGNANLRLTNAQCSELVNVALKWERAHPGHMLSTHVRDMFQPSANIVKHVRECIHPGVNLAKTDDLWALSVCVLNNTITKADAFTLMDQFYSIIFIEGEPE